jgi:protein-S-isoprenylcysteine O-methyltransferase Ste14
MNWIPQHWPALVVALVLLLYWARVLKLVYKTRKRTGHGANFVPPEPLGRLLRVLWYPVVGLWILLPLIHAFGLGRFDGLELAYDVPWITWPAAMIAVAALAATWICWKRMGKSWRMGIDPQETTQLVMTGPYAYVRHPIYALSSLLMLATVAVVPSVAMAIVGLLHLAFLQWEARREEQFLLQQHGSLYEEYCRKVRRFIPRPS